MTADEAKMIHACVLALEDACRVSGAESLLTVAMVLHASLHEGAEAIDRLKGACIDAARAALLAAAAEHGATVEQQGHVFPLALLVQPRQTTDPREN